MNRNRMYWRSRKKYILKKSCEINCCGFWKSRHVLHYIIIYSMKISTMMLYNNITYVVDDMFLQRTLFIKNYIVDKILFWFFLLLYILPLLLFCYNCRKNEYYNWIDLSISFLIIRNLEKILIIILKQLLGFDDN